MVGACQSGSGEEASQVPLCLCTSFGSPDRFGTMTHPKPSTSQIPKSRKSRIDLTSQTPQEILQLSTPSASPFYVEKTVREARKNWDLFYKNSGSKFFLDRHWTQNEFEVLRQLEDDENGYPQGKGKGKIVLEVGCGTGAFIYPLLERYPLVRFHAFDFSKRAVDLVKSHERYSTSSVHAFVHDLTEPEGCPTLLDHLSAAPPEFCGETGERSADSETEYQAPDVISCIYVLSALPPKTQAKAVEALVSNLSPGGTLILRDYAIHDTAQLRFHTRPSEAYATIPPLLSTVSDPSKGPEEAWYRRGDGTMSYFFGKEEMDRLVKDSVEDGWEMKGECEVVERDMNNRAEGWGCTRKFVHGSWTKRRIPGA